MRRANSEIPKKDMTLVVSKDTFEWVTRTAKAQNKSRSCVIEEILLDNLPEEFQN